VLPSIIKTPEESSMALLTVKELEADSKISRHTWRAWIRQGRLPVIRAGRRVRVAEEDYRRFLAERRVPAREEATRR
jgi:excisionase family DNA binding protein